MSPALTHWQRRRSLNLTQDNRQGLGGTELSTMLINQSVPAILFDQLKPAPIVKASIEPYRLRFAVDRSPATPNMVSREIAPNAVNLRGFFFTETGHDGK